MVDANQKWDLMQARRRRDYSKIWICRGWKSRCIRTTFRAHRALKRAPSIPIALGEHVYTTHAFRDYIESGAVRLMQVDVCRIGGVTPWLEVAAMANANGIRVCPHAAISCRCISISCGRSPIAGTGGDSAVASRAVQAPDPARARPVRATAGAGRIDGLHAAGLRRISRQLRASRTIVARVCRHANVDRHGIL